ncbi:MAG: prepilin-type N-terminal cleavage/methylation domain-containing protein [Candidatus Aureabacteria bacterium]|nr:prepilin-type N-terminal cleavage/methylation domain-containing protein [Candidatus Auribacterota bacterium]
MKSTKKRKNAFTIIELMIVVAILGLLTVIATPGILQARLRARENTCRNNMRVIAHAIEQYSLEYNITSNTFVSLYNDNIMPATDVRKAELFVPKYLKCPEADATYGEVNNSNLNVTCPVTTPGRSHGTFGDVI